MTENERERCTYMYDMRVYALVAVFMCVPASVPMYVLKRKKGKGIVIVGR